MIFLALALALLAPPAHAVTIVHSNDVLGEIEPCGCRSNPLGGYARKANLLKQMKDRQMIQLDAGDLLFPSDSVPPLLRKQSFVQARWILRILDLLHQDAVTPGEKDFALGVRAFQQLISGSHVKFIAANLLDAQGKELLPPSVIFRRKDVHGKTVRVAVLGLVGKAIPWPDHLHATDPIEVAKKLVPGLRKRADFVVALTHEGYRADKELASAVPGIDIIIGGHTQTFLQTPQRVGKTMIYQSSFRNQYVGLINLSTFRNPDAYQMVGLDANYDSPKGHPGPVDRAVMKFKAAIAKLNSDEVFVPMPPGHSKYQTFPRCSECHLKQFLFWSHTPHAMALVALVRKHQDKNKECLQCHTVGLGKPGGFTNVNAMIQLTTDKHHPAFLPAKKFVDYLKSLHDAKSLSSPARGLSSTPMTVYQSLSHLKLAWTPVQCEDCHGPGENHPMSGAYPKQVSMQVCLSCHTPTRAPQWYLPDGKPDWAKIKAKHALMACPTGDISGGN